MGSAYSRTGRFRHRARLRVASGRGRRPWIPLAGALAAVVVALVLFFWWKGQPFAEGDVFRASRLSSGNRLFPTQVLITPTSVVHYTPELIGRKEHSIHIAHVASVSIDTNLFFSNVLIETTGGTTPVRATVTARVTPCA